MNLKLNDSACKAARRPASATSGLAINITAGKGGDKPLLAREILSVADLQMGRDDTWWTGFRQGKLTAKLHALSVKVLPGQLTADGYLNDYWIELGNGKESFRKKFPASSVYHVAMRALLRLTEKEKTELDGYEYSLIPQPDDGSEETEEEVKGKAKLIVKARSESLILERASLNHYLEQSEPLTGPSTPLLKGSPGEQQAVAIFVCEEVWQQGRDHARRGGERESAAVWTGRLMRDSDSPELFLLLDACLEAEHAQEETVSLRFTGDTWGQVRQRLEQRRRRLNRPHEIILGSVHGHNFKPLGVSAKNGACEKCEKRETCSQTTAVASAQDFEWHRAVFGGQPWAILVVWGWDVRSCEDWRAYGLANASLVQYPIRRLKK